MDDTLCLCSIFCSSVLCVQACPRGHSICIECRKKVEICPTCRAPLEPNSNSHILKKIVNTLLPLPCKFEHLGCDFKAKSRAGEGSGCLDRHEESCGYR